MILCDISLLVSLFLKDVYVGLCVEITTFTQPWYFLLCFFIDVGWRTGAIVSSTCQNASASLMFTTNPITAAFLYYSNLNRMCNPFEGSRKTPTRRSIWSAMNLTALWLNDSELIEYYDTTWGKYFFLVSSPSSKRTQNYKHRHWIKSQFLQPLGWQRKFP